MQIEITPGIVGRGGGVSWGTDASGAPVLLIESAGGCVRLSMTAAEACEHGQQAIFIGFGAALAAGQAGAARPVSGLVGPSGAPL